MNGPMTANEVSKHLLALARELDTTVSQLEEADLDAATKRAEYDFAYSTAFVSGDGAMDMRRHQAVIDTADLRMAAEVAEALVRHLRRRVSALDKRIEVGRTYGATVRSELKTLGVHT